MITDSEPDLVLLDVQMPGLTGFEVARRLLDGNLDAHIVFVTAFDQYAIGSVRSQRRRLPAQAG